MQPKTFVIADVNSKISARNLAKTQQSAAQWGWQLEVWPAVVGSSINADSWEEIGVRLLERGAIQYRPGAQGCWFSHWSLWNHCVELDQPVVVLEHDAEILGVWPENIDLDRCVWKLHRPDGRGDRNNEITGLWSCGSWAYTLTPRWAGQLIEFSRQHGAQAIDKQLGSAAVTWQYWYANLCGHGPAVRSSTTSPKVKNKINIIT